ncbi:hypothetical protein VNO77_24042 [Canavalia gladiata]|uniref:Uncharacterized protein n=1 Tax=Canavalia gladiata TaxID=3824 RepID=A0AAN9L6S8_CANGL
MNIHCNVMEAGGRDGFRKKEYVWLPLTRSINTKTDKMPFAYPHATIAAAATIEEENSKRKGKDSERELKEVMD